MSALPLRPQVFAILSSLIEERAGLHYGLDDIDMIADKLSTRAIDAGFESLLDYYYFLRYDESSKAELDALVDALVVNETYFFRELDPLKRVVSDFIQPLAASGSRPRVWCAACSTGEEPLTLAMLLAELDLLDKVDIVASDISVRALTRARAGEVGLRALRGAPPAALVARYLVTEGGRQRVRRDLIEAIRWLRVNLVEPEAVARLGAFDVILCRNVLIYFSDATVKAVLDSLAAALRPGGALFVGTSESLLRFGTLLSCEERGGVFFYRKEHV
jgi:chemotaxis protein methyltransferase CheR